MCSFGSNVWSSPCEQGAFSFPLEAPACGCQAQNPGWMLLRAVSSAALCSSCLDLLNGLSLGPASKLKPNENDSYGREDLNSYGTVPQGIMMSLTEGMAAHLFQQLSPVCTPAPQEEWAGSVRAPSLVLGDLCCQQNCGLC